MGCKILKRLFRFGWKNGQKAEPETRALTSVVEVAKHDGSLNLDTPSSSKPPPADNESACAPSPGEPSSKLPPTSITNDTPIRELWVIAYEKLREDNEELIKNYEEKLQGELGASLVSALGSKVSPRDRMHAILQRRMEQINRDVWKLKFGSSEIQARDMVQPVLSVVSWANRYISTAVSTNPQASMAWAGVSLLLSLLLNPSEQDAALKDGLEYISSLIDQSLMWEDLYIRRYDTGHNMSESSMPTHFAYKNALEKLYRQILKFQATSYCYCAGKAALRLVVDVAKLNEWNGLSDDIRAKEREFRSVSDSWRDAKYDEECLAAENRHKEALRHWQAIGSGVSGLQEAVCDAQEEKKRDGFLDWLCEVDPSEIYNSARDSCEDGTGHWLLQDSKEFRTWESAPQSVLWLHGKPGCGKSVLSSSVIKHLQEKYASDPGSAFAYFFFSFSDQKKQKVPVMLASLVKQLYASRPDTPQPIKDLGVYKRAGTRPDTKTLENALIATAAGFSSVSIVIDALDECPTINEERKKLLSSLNRIVDKMPDTLHIFLTSRKELDIERDMNMILRQRSGAVINLTTDQRGVNHDIGLYIDATLASAQYGSWPTDVKAKAKDLLVQRADGMFQYLVYQFEALRGLGSAADVDEALERLPRGLTATYDRIIQNIDSSLRPQVINLFKWLVASERPLELRELADIWMIRPECTPVIDKRHKLFTPQDCLRCISSMTIQFRRYGAGGRIYVRLAHFSVKEYLTSDGIDGLFTEAEAHHHIARSCLTCHLYLTTAGENDVVKFSLKDYAVRNWGFHLEKVPRGMWSDNVVRLATQALVAYSKSLHRMILTQSYWFSGWMAYSKEPFIYTMFDHILQRPLCHTAKLGFLELTEMLLQNGYFTQQDLGAALAEAADADEPAIVHLPPKGARAYREDSKTLQIHIGTNLRNASMMDFLLSKGADINAQNGERGSVLEAAISGHKPHLVQQVIQLGAGVNLPSINKWGYPLILAAYCCSEIHEEPLAMMVIELLLDSGADVNIQGGEFGNALQATCASFEERNQQSIGDNDNYYRSVVELLLSRGANINARGGTWGTALQAACCSNGRPGAVKLLLEKGADINIKGGKYGSALHAACAWRNREIIELLLCWGADVNLEGEEFGGVLHGLMVQAYGSHCYNPVPLAKLLLDHGADVNAQGGERGNALQAACCSSRNEDVVRILLDHGADINAQGGECGSALQAACYYSNEGVIRMLLGYGADVNAQGGRHGSALQAACYRGNKDDHVVRMLLSHGADVNAQGGRHGSALQSACYYSNKGVVRMLLDHGADVNAQGRERGNALQAACYHGNTDVVRMLLDHGADVNAQGGECGSALQAACYYSNEDVVHMLLDHGADVNAQGGDYGSALQAACSNNALLWYRMDGSLSEIDSKYWDIVHLLIERGGDIRSQEDRFGTAWQVAASNIFDGVEPMLQFLLDQGADVNDGRGLPQGTALQMFLESYRPIQGTKPTNQRIRFLLERGADVNVRAGRYGFALQSACANKHSAQPVQFLLQNCPTLDVNAVGGMFGTALQAAAYSHQTESVTSLLDKGADPNIRGGKYRSALNIAIFRGFWDIVAILLDRGAKSDRQLLPEPDEEWLATMVEEGIEDWDPENDFHGQEHKNEDGKEAVERYRVFWRKQPRGQDEN
ncbi:putative ankyrin repeat protein [Rosellinia necatrix]|uniref:Putative ankyrin repeat protein n=1 Tax=Rosellinia necatrix TaxID=77044 RepID=A0A1W2TVJ9_ROSNE|nr:putative ankyrin repeat protein [Rosellinia necatrix]